jgi:hypothetical protein
MFRRDLPAENTGEIFCGRHARARILSGSVAATRSARRIRS